MIPMPRLDLGILGVRRRARFQLIRRLLKRGIQRPSSFPA